MAQNCSSYLFNCFFWRGGGHRLYLYPFEFLVDLNFDLNSLNLLNLDFLDLNFHRLDFLALKVLGVYYRKGCSCEKDDMDAMLCDLMCLKRNTVPYLSYETFR